MLPDVQKKPIILLVDDEPTFIHEMGGMLSKLALVRVALSGQEALDIIQSDMARPDLILLDILMPNMDGYETCRRIRALNFAKEIPIIFITSLASKHDEIKALEGGALDFITKPVQIPFLMHKILNHLELIRIRDQALMQVRSELRTAQETRRALFDALPDVIMRFDLQGKYIFVSPNVKEIVPLQATQFPGRTVQEIGFPGRSVNQWEEAIRNVVETQVPFQTEIFFHGKLGPAVHELRLVPEFDSQGMVCSVLGISRDLTEIQLKEEQIKQKTTINQAQADLIRVLTAGDSSLQDMATAVHEWAMNITGSKFGFTSSIDPTTGDSVGHSLSVMMEGNQCRVTDQKISFPKGPDGYSGLWGVALNTRHGFFTNDPGSHPAATGLPEGHIPLEQFLATPAIFQNQILGEIALANPGRKYNQEDLRAVTVLAELFALAIHRLRNTEEIHRAREQAEEAGRVKNEFLTNMSHEIRTPLNGILGMLQLLQGSSLNKEQEEYVELAVRSSQRLTSLLSDVLDLARIESGRLPVDCKPFALKDVLESVEQLFLPAGRKKGIGFFLDISPNLPEKVSGDASRLRQILNNLVGNAIKFTEAGSVVLDAMMLPHAQGGQCRILFTVSDSGIGIPDDKLPRLFNPFSQAAEGFTRSYQGAGLGLAIVKRLVDLMGGTLSLCSEHEVGTSVCISLPFGLISSGQSRQEKIRTLAERNNLEFRVLLAEDDPISQFAAIKQLERLGCRVTAVDNGQAVLEKLLLEDFDILLMDIQMPYLDGLQTAKIIKTSSKFRKIASIPIVALTAYVLDADGNKFQEMGIDLLISKPVRLESLAEAILQCVLERKSPEALRLRN